MQCHSMRAGRIILVGVLAIAVMLLAAVLLPPPSAERHIKEYIPTGATEHDRRAGPALAAVALSTTQDLSGVLEFYRRKFDIPQRFSPRSGMATMSRRSSLFGRFRSDAIMPLSGSSGHAVTFCHREAGQVVYIAMSRAEGEGLSHIMLVLEQLPDRNSRRAWSSSRNEAAAWPPPNGTPGSSGSALGAAVAEFTTPLRLEDVVRFYSTNTGLSRPQVFLEQPRAQAKAVLLEPTKSSRQSFYIFCYQDIGSTQSQVSVSWISK